MRIGDVRMKILSKKKAVEHFMEVKGLEKTGLRAKVLFSTQHTLRGGYFAIEIEPRLFYVHSDGAITSELPT